MACSRWIRPKIESSATKAKMIASSSSNEDKVKEERMNSINCVGVLTEILSRLPIKSICSFRRVCRNWNELTKEDYFIREQLAESRENPTFISCPSIVQGTRMNLYSLRQKSCELCTLNKIDLRGDEYYMYVMISSFNGLICCINVVEKNNFCDVQIWICNPCTGKTLLLPKGTPSFKVEPSVGVAYASDISDYIIFRIFCCCTTDDDEKKNGLVYECEVYSSITCSWKNIGRVPRIPMHVYFSPYRSVHVFVGGKIFWLVSLDQQGEILSVDLQGRFEVISLPPYPENIKEEDGITECTYLLVLQGSLSLVILHPDYMDIWVWKKEDNEFTWELLREDVVPFQNYEIILAMTSSNNQILCVTETEWWTYDLDTGLWSNEPGPSFGFANPSIFPFTESFLTCDGGVKL